MASIRWGLGTGADLCVPFLERVPVRLPADRRRRRG